MTPGYGDSATWPACTGHPNDPRTEPYEPTSYDMALDDAMRRVQRREVDLADVDAVDALMTELIARYELDDDDVEQLDNALWRELNQRRAARRFLDAFYGMEGAR